jgi:hypothetical protein
VDLNLAWQAFHRGENMTRLNAAGIIGPFLLLALPFSTSVAAQTPCPNPPAVTVSQTTPPSDVCIPSNFNQLPIQFFDDFSWRSLIALVWPAKSGSRGDPDTTKALGAPGPLVFETYKYLQEVFHNDASAPSAWNSFDLPTYNPCSRQMAFGDLYLASFSKFSNLGEAGFGTLRGPLVAQNQTYVRFLTSFSQTTFEAIQNGKWFDKSNIPATGVTFRDGAIDVKSSWIDMKDRDPSRFYTRKAWLQNPVTNMCSETLVGLVGIHIVQKTPSRPQWIWSSFEQVDNVPENGAIAPFTFNKGDGVAMPASNPRSFPPEATPQPFNVSRIQPINASTDATNAAYQAKLANTPWRFYKLVVTQWPVCTNAPCNQSMRGVPANTSPGSNTMPMTAFSNTTMETFEQSTVSAGCMACHNIVQTVMGVRQGTDYLWTLRNHAATAAIPNLALATVDKEEAALKSLLRTTTISKPDSRSAAKREKVVESGKKK